MQNMYRSSGTSDHVYHIYGSRVREGFGFVQCKYSFMLSTTTICAFAKKTLSKQLQIVTTPLQQAVMRVIFQFRYSNDRIINPLGYSGADIRHKSDTHTYTHFR